MAILHLTRTLPALLPRYVTRFRCTGPECEDNCCTGWEVALDKKTFTAYRQSKHPALNQRFAASIKRHRSRSNDLQYGRIELNTANGACPLMEDRLCAVQKNLDESHLSHTCFTYPRVSRNFGGQFEQALTLSCPEAARQALLQPDALDFVEGTITVRMDVVNQVVAHHGIPLELMNELRIFCLNLVRTEDLELWQRLAVLGVFCESLSDAVANGRQATLRALVDDFARLVEQGQVHQALAAMQPDHSAQAMVFSTLWGRTKFVTVSPVQNKVIDAIARGLGADASGQVTGERLIASYRHGVGRLPQALAAAPRLLEHYVLNEMFSSLFPFDGPTPYDSYLQLVSRFGLLRLMLAAQCNSDGPLPDADALARTVQVFARRFQHDQRFAVQVNQALKNSGWSKLEKLYGFLRT